MSDLSSPFRRNLLISSVGVGAGVGFISGHSRFMGQANAAPVNKIKTPAKSMAGKGGRVSTIIRDFHDPMLELLRLLQEGAEIEHDLMIQYMYAGFSLKPAYNGLIGQGDPNAKDFLGVAIQEMQHLGAVNRFLAELGASPILKRQDFPYEVDIYPFPFELKSCSRYTAAHYMYCESPDNIMDPITGDHDLLVQVASVLGTSLRPNFVGHLYQQIIDLTFEVEKDPHAPKLDWDTWREKLHHIMEEGEVDHFKFFKEVFLGTQETMLENSKKVGKNVWDLPANHDLYPSFALADNPTAYYGHPNAIQNREALKLAWLGNLIYWLSMTILDSVYRGKLKDGHFIAHEVMLVTLLPLCRHLPQYGYGMPFDPLSMAFHGYNKILLMRLIAETRHMVNVCKGILPDDFPLDFFDNFEGRFEGMV